MDIVEDLIGVAPLGFEFVPYLVSTMFAVGVVATVLSWFGLVARLRR